MMFHLFQITDVPPPTEAEFEYKLAETDAYLQLMIEQVKVSSYNQCQWQKLMLIYS